MVWSKITSYAMLTPERHYEIQQEIRARQAAHAARIAAGLPPDSPGEAEDEEMAPVEVEEPDQQVRAFNLEQAEFVVTQSDEMAEQQAILEPVQDEAYVEANWLFLRREEAELDALFAELDTKKAGAEQPEESELQLPPMLPKPGTEIVVISDKE